jgi:hypothetical protein
MRCNPTDPASISKAVLTLYYDRNLAQDMGRRGRERILSSGNYETQFAPVLEILERETVSTRPTETRPPCLVAFSGDFVSMAVLDFNGAVFVEMGLTT